MTNKSSAVLICFSLGCDVGWLKFGSHCYFFNHDKKGMAVWNDAVQTCRLLGGSLVEIRNEAEWMFVKSLLEPGPTIKGVAKQYMIGMSDTASEGRWKFVDGNSAFLKWGRSEPNGGRGENCGAMSANSGLYNDGPCHHKYGRFICKKAVA